MSVLLHLSDLHLGSERAEQSEILDALASAVASERRQRGRDVDLVVISGDVFESASLEIPRATRAFSRPLEDVASSAPRLELPVVSRVRARRDSVVRAERSWLEPPDEARGSPHA